MCLQLPRARPRTQPAAEECAPDGKDAVAQVPGVAQPLDSREHGLEGLVQELVEPIRRCRAIAAAVAVAVAAAVAAAVTVAVAAAVGLLRADRFALLPTAVRGVLRAPLATALATALAIALATATIGSLRSWADPSQRGGSELEGLGGECEGCARVRREASDCAERRSRGVDVAQQVDRRVHER